MKKLLKKARDFLRENYEFNEVELTDTKGNKVRLVRNTPIFASWTYPLGWNPPQSQHY